MRFTDMLKPKTEVIKQDGKEYQFTPGNNGSLTIENEKYETPLVEKRERKAKMITPKVTTVGATRG